MGVNFGRLGFLASFTPDELQHSVEALLAGKLPIRSRMMIEAAVRDGGTKQQFLATALNDAVITAGPPFKMIELEISADEKSGQHSGGVFLIGDGVIISTPSGSTAYNVSAGGPIVNPGVDCMCITPICPHSLSFRPVVVAADSTIVLTAVRVNAGTTLFCDGQVSTRLNKGDRVTIRRSPHDALLIENPHAREWRSLAEKLHWAVSPRYSGGK
jgi:NAD+ kinase